MSDSSVFYLDGFQGIFQSGDAIEGSSFQVRFVGYSAGTGFGRSGEDLVQECFIKLWKSRDKLETYKSLEHVAMRIIKNLAIDEFRKSNNYADVDSLRIADSTPNYEDNVIATENRNQVQAALGALSEPYHTVLFLRAIEELEIQDISERMNLKYNTVHVILSRARGKIKEKLKYLENE